MHCLFDLLNCNFKKHFSASDHSIDETMIPYFAKHGTKQFICGKPIRFVFKLWCFASIDGYLFHAEPYCGDDSKLANTGLGQCADVVLDLVEKDGLSSGFSVTFDNLFTSFPLLDESFQNVASEVCLLLGKIVWKMQQFHRNKQTRK